ncbi:MAG: hypothetical protein FWC18_04730 [Cystobacterineae bacterium]|nr:hypothetical protein [Cystobacterineae bacterium]
MLAVAFQRGMVFATPLPKGLFRVVFERDTVVALLHPMGWTQGPPLGAGEEGGEAAEGEEAEGGTEAA